MEGFGNPNKIWWSDIAAAADGRTPGFRQRSRSCALLRLQAKLGLLLLLLHPILSPATSPQLSLLLPTGGQRGTEIELSLHGDRLDDAEEIICHEPGLEILKTEISSGKLVKATVKIANDCALGEHHLRLRTKSGLSELRTFSVGPFPVVAEKEPNNDASKAQRIALNSTVTGVIIAEDMDCFAVQLREGQRLSVDVEGMRLGRTLFDPRIAVLDPSGLPIATADDSWLGVQDPSLSLVASKDGLYILQLRESTYGGSDKCHYRLHVGTFSRPIGVFPLGGRAGETVSFKFLDAPKGEFEQTFRLPQTAQERFGLFAERDGLTAPTPNWIRVSEFPNVMVATPNQDREHATSTDLQLPVAFNGILSKPGQEDWFRFPVKKDVAVEVSVFARRLRSPLDSSLQVFDAKGKSVASDEDSAGMDSFVKFTPTESTNYYVRVRDTLGHGGRDYVYRIEAVPAQPKLTVKIPEVARNDTQSRQFICVPRGNRVATLISAKRANFSGELSFATDELQGGVTLRADPIPNGGDSMPLVFEASPDAQLGCRLVDLIATGTNRSGTVSGRFRQTVELVQGPNNSVYYSTSVDKLCVAVVEKAPFHLRIVEPDVPLVQSGSMPLQIVADRADGFDEPIQLKMVWNPPGVSSQSEATIPKGATNVFYQLNANAGAETRASKIAVVGHGKVNGGELYVSSQLAKLEIASPFLSGKIETTLVKPGQKASVTVTLQQAKPFEGKATVRLLGLPEKITAGEKEITKDDRQVVFELKVDPNCAAGSHKNLFCAVDVKQNGAVIPHTIAAGGLLRIAPPKEATKVAAAEKR